MNTATPVRGFDFHCHVDLFPDPAAAIAACERERIVTLAVTTTPKAWTQNRRWTGGSRYVHSAVGLHPELAGERHPEIVLLEKLIAETSFVGEVGLDGSPPHRGTMAVQREVFNRALAAAERCGGRVVSIHSRRAAKEVLDCLATQTTPARVLPILHWFSDGASLARRAAEQGCYFSINHRMLDSEARAALIRDLPGDRILTETDAPFTEIGHRKSEPADVVDTAQQLATLRAVSHHEMRDTLAANAARVFAFAGIDVSFHAQSA
jgi:TatD DNase family protein